MVWKFLKQNVLFPNGLNWIQHWVSGRIWSIEINEQESQNNLNKIWYRVLTLRHLTRGQHPKRHFVNLLEWKFDSYSFKFHFPTNATSHFLYITTPSSCIRFGEGLYCSKGYLAGFQNTPSLFSIWIKCIVLHVSFFKRRRQHTNKWGGILKSHSLSFYGGNLTLINMLDTKFWCKFEAGSAIYFKFQPDVFLSS